MRLLRTKGVLKVDLLRCVAQSNSIKPLINSFIQIGINQKAHFVFRDVKIHKNSLCIFEWKTKNRLQFGMDSHTQIVREFDQ